MPVSIAESERTNSTSSSRNSWRNSRVMNQGLRASSGLALHINANALRQYTDYENRSGSPRVSIFDDVCWENSTTFRGEGELEPPIGEDAEAEAEAETADELVGAGGRTGWVRSTDENKSASVAKAGSGLREEVSDGVSDSVDGSVDKEKGRLMKRKHLSDRWHGKFKSLWKA